MEVLHHPDYDPGDMTLMIMQDHIQDVGTGSYSDVKCVLEAIHTTLIVLRCLKLVFVFGDQQV